MQRKPYLPGEVVRITLTVKDLAGAPVDPGGLTLTVQGPNTLKILLAAPDVVKVSAGNYYADFQIPPESRAGAWAWRWDLTAPNAGASEGAFVVQRSLMM